MIEIKKQIKTISIGFFLAIISVLFGFYFIFDIISLILGKKDLSYTVDFISVLYTTFSFVAITYFIGKFLKNNLNLQEIKKIFHIQ